jgi:serine protease
MKKTQILLSLFLVFTLLSCRKEEDWSPAETPLKLSLKSKQHSVPEGPPISREELDRRMMDTLEIRKDFQWERMGLHALWSALQYGDHSLSIGYGPAGIADFRMEMEHMDIQSTRYRMIHDALIELILEELKIDKSRFSKEVLVEDDKVLPILTIRTTNKNLVTRLYNLENVRYLEPIDYAPEVIQSGSGCGGSTTSLNSSDYTTIVPGCLLPWNYGSAGITSAWNISQGQGITIGLIDAGISSSQSLLGSQFNSGYSTGRTLTVGYNYGTTAYTSCVHGTSMCGLAAGARNNANAVCGVAYKSNLFFIRACDDVVLTSSNERLAVKNALTTLGNTAAVKVISMSIGTPFSSSTLKDGVDYAYAMGKLIFAAAGTSYSWTSWWGVIYPAAYSSCIAVTGIREDGTTCSTCHDGSEVRFTITMERTINNDRNTISLAPTGTTATYVGGSSSATATAAGIAALVWSVRPSMSRDQVYSCLKNTAQYFPNLSNVHGYGKINANAAVHYALSWYVPVL